jgi:ABC-type multidrug transport system ATPase subunit
VSFTVEQGEIFGILGPNGAGKTTAVESMASRVCAARQKGPFGRSERAGEGIPRSGGR